MVIMDTPEELEAEREKRLEERRRRKNEYAAKWYAANREEKAAKARARYRETRERHNEATMRYRMRHKEEWREYYAAWKARNPEKLRQYNITRCAKDRARRRERREKRGAGRSG